jgi:hypothetical protein
MSPAEFAYGRSRPQTSPSVMTSLVVLTLVLVSLLLGPLSFVRTGRWTVAAYRRYVVGIVVLYAVAVALIVTRFGRG